MTDNVLEVRGLAKAFGGEGGVRDVDLHLARSEVISLLGPSGCGKTTTLRCIAGFYKPDAGSITIGGRLVASRDVFVPPEDRQIAMVFQNYVLWPHMTAFQNIAYGLKLRHVARDEIRTRVDEMLALLGLTGLGARYPHELSGGQQQRVSVARSLVVRPQVLLLDEPFSNLDAKLRIEMRQEMRDLLQRLGISAVYVTHDQEEAMVISDRILLMDSGAIVEQGAPSELFEAPRTEFAARFFGVVNMIPGVFSKRDGRGSLALDGLAASVALPAHLDGEDGRRYVLGLREDEIEVRPRGTPAADWIDGIIRGRYYIGRAVELEIEVQPGRVLRCRAEGRAAVAWPAEVSLRVVPERAILLPAPGSA
jgi:ABC-type Fe3+/spermidine/putrescine transport system ATPase subunit